MNEIDKYGLVITRLIQETQQETIEWNSYVDSDKEIKLVNEGEVIDKVYRTIYKYRMFRLFKYRYKVHSGGTFSPQSEQWDYDIKLEILDDYGYPEWEFPIVNSLSDLYETVRYKVSGIKNLIDEILGLEIIKAEYSTNKHTLDVTKQLTAKIENNKLHITASNDIAGDPDIGTPKTLKIKYRFQGKFNDKEFKEGQQVDLP